jgi:cell division protein FtsB
MIKEGEFFVQILPTEKSAANAADGVKPTTTKQ